MPIKKGPMRRTKAVSFFFLESRGGRNFYIDFPYLIEGKFNDCLARYTNPRSPNRLRADPDGDKFSIKYILNANFTLLLFTFKKQVHRRFRYSWCSRSSDRNATWT